jgi:acetylornithine deacetylase/succinyl-diaminopimelate desuccinylase-like protein
VSAAGFTVAPPEAGAELRRLLRRVCETPAPTFAEEARAALVAELLREAGLTPRWDAAGNVLAEPAGGRGPRVALVAHVDTVFDAGVDVRIREGDDGRWRAPGIGDNAASVAVLLHLAAEAARGRLPDRPRLLLAFTVGEEGLGDLRGARRLLADEGGALDAFVAIDGHLGSVVDAAVGSRRLRVELRSAGGHAWGDYPSPSAVHALGDAVHALTRIPVPEAPRSSLNVGQVRGGTAINAIAAEAWATVDVRSVDAETLARLAAEAEKRLRSVARRHRVEGRIERVGERPAGRSDDGRLARRAEEALRAHGVEPRRGASSTDANVAMAAGLPALCLGVYRGGDAHRLEEWLEPDSLATGAAVLRTLLSGWEDGAVA